MFKVTDSPDREQSAVAPTVNASDHLRSPPSGTESTRGCWGGVAATVAAGLSSVENQQIITEQSFPGYYYVLLAF